MSSTGNCIKQSNIQQERQLLTNAVTSRRIQRRCGGTRAHTYRVCAWQQRRGNYQSLRAEWGTVTDELKSPASRSLLEELSVQFSRAGRELERHLPVLEFGAEAESPGRQERRRVAV